MGAPRSTSIRDRHRNVIARGRPPCGICGQPIDYSLRYPDPGSFEVDHIIPLGPKPSRERIARLDVLANKQAAHRRCNRDKSDRLDGGSVLKRSGALAI